MTPTDKKLRKAYDRINREGDKWAVNLYAALALALYRHHGMKKLAVTRLVDVTWAAWRECAVDADSSMIKMCAEELGIEIQNGSGVSYTDVAYLNGQDLGDMTLEQILYMRAQQLKWVRPQIMACILIGLNRKYGWGFVRLSRIHQEIDEIDREYKSNPKSLANAALAEVGVDVKGMIFQKREATNE